MPYRVLSLDGGGIRGVYTARLLSHLERRVPGALGRADLFAGTSTGGIIALGLAAGLGPDRLVDLYRQLGPQIFHAGLLRAIGDADGLLGARYRQGALRAGLEQVFERERGLRRLADLPRRVLIPAFDLDDGAYARRDPRRPRAWKPKFFHNFPGPDSDGAEEIVAVALRTSAAPSFFPSYGRFIDGGVAANNPAMAALALALDPALGGQAQGAIRLLSVGTGFSPHFVAGADLDWGLAEWAPHLLDLALDADTDVVDYQCRQILGAGYRRISGLFAKPVGLDAVGQVGRLIELADALAESRVFAELAAWVEQAWRP